MRVNLKELPVNTTFIFYNEPSVMGEIKEAFSNNEKYIYTTSKNGVGPPLSLKEDIWEDVIIIVDVEFEDKKPDYFYQLTFDDLK